MYLLDTNAVIGYLSAIIPNPGMTFMHQVTETLCSISVITEMELLGFNFSSPSELKSVELFVTGALVIDLDRKIVLKTIELRKKKRVKLPDAIIAATAIVNDLTLISRNTSDFHGIDMLTVLDPWNT